MPRPSQGLDRALLEAGIEEIKLGGVRGLSVRAVCARAGVNIRMLNYYFGTKDEFVRQLLTKTYEYFFQTLHDSAQSKGDPLERLQKALRVSIAFATENRAMTRSLWMDANAGVPLVTELVQKVFPQHTNLLFELLYEAWQQGALRQDVSPMQIFSAVIPGVFVPCLWHEKLFPKVLPSIPSELRELPDDPVDAAMLNFTCLIEGFRAHPDACAAVVAPSGCDDVPPATTKPGRKVGQRSRIRADKA